MNQRLRAVDKVEITTLQDNYIDILARDGSAVVQRANPLVGREVKNSILAEHGFSALVTVTLENSSRTLLFDFGFSAHGAAFTADALSLDLSGVDAESIPPQHVRNAYGIRFVVRRTPKGLEWYIWQRGDG